MAEKVANKEALKKIEDQLDCAICLQPYTDPKLLPCFHIFCKHCLERIVVRNPDGSTIACPKCRQTTALPPKGVSTLQSAFYIDHLFEIRDTLQKAKEPQKAQCEKCKKSTATGFCRDCGKFVCRKCIEVHKLFEEISEHQIISLSEVHEKASTLTPTKTKAPYCNKHAKQELKIYCETCKELICTNCTIRLHLGHQYDLVADAFPKHQEEIHVHLQPVRQHLEMVNKALQALDTRTKEIGDQRMAIEADIHKQIDQLHQALDQRRAELIGQLDHITQRKLKSLAAQRDQTEMLQAKLVSCLEYVEGSLTTSTPAEVRAMKEPTIKQIKGITTDLSPDSLAPKEDANTELVIDNLQQHCQKFGTVLAQRPRLDPTQCHVVGHDSKSATVDKQTSITLQTVDESGKELMVPVKDISAELVHCTDHTITQCEVKGKGKGKYTVTYTPATRGRHQLHIKVGKTPIGCSPLPIIARLPLHRLGNPVQFIRNLSDPRGVAVNSKGQILVSETGGKKQVSVYSPDRQRIQSFDNMKYPWGICFDSENKILVVDHSGHQIHQFSSNGEHLQSIGTRGTNQLQFNYPIGIIYSSKSKKIYVTEYNNHRVQVLNEDLSFSATFGTRGNGNGQLSMPRGAAVDTTGNLYVADYGNNRIQVYTPDGQFLHVFGTKGSGAGQLSGPTDICIDGSDTVYVTELGNNHVFVFTTQGQFQTSFGQGHFGNPHGITMDEDGFVFVSDYIKNQIIKF